MVHPTTNPADMKIGGDPNYAIVFQEMKRLGYIEGTNLIVDRYSADGRFDLFSAIARDIVATRPDVIFAGGEGAWPRNFCRVGRPCGQSD
jgi:hypothetical protein